MQYSFSVIPRVSALIRLWPSFCQLVRGVVPRDKILVQSLAAFSRLDGIAFLFIRTEIKRFSFERDLRAPSSGAPVPVNAGHAAGVGGAQAPSASFQNGNGRTLAELEIFQKLLFLQAAAAFPVARCKLVQRRVNFPAAVTATAPDGVAVFVLGRCFFRARMTDMIADGNFCVRYALSVWSYRLPHRT